MLKRFLKQQRSVAALEFALVAPLIVVLLFGVYDLSSALIFYEEIYSATHSMAASISNEAVQENGTNALTYTQVQQAASILWAEIPSMRSGLQDGVKSVTISSIVFEQTDPYDSRTGTGCNPSSTQQCNYAPVIVWSVAYMGGDSGRSFQTPTNKFDNGTWTAVGYPLRSCIGTASKPSASTIIGSLSQSLPNAGSSSDLTNLRTYNLTTPAPANPAPPSPTLVVDVHVDYQPVIGMFIGKTLPLWVNGYWPVRSVQVSTTQTYALNEEFVTLTPDNTSSDTPVYLADNTAGNTDMEIYDADNNLVSTDNYCVNTALYGAYGASPETQ